MLSQAANIISPEIAIDVFVRIILCPYVRYQWPPTNSSVESSIGSLTLRQTGAFAFR